MKIRLSLFCVLALCFLNISTASAVMTGKTQKAKQTQSSFSFTDYFKKVKAVTFKQVAKSKKLFKKSKAQLAKAKAVAKAKGKGGKTGLVRIGLALMIVGVIAGFILWVLGIAGVGSFLFRLGFVLVVIGVILWLLGLIF